MLSYYPPITAYQEDMLVMDEIHTVFVEQCGNPKGLPVLFLHGGPGSGCKPDHRRYFDPQIYRIILFDQRGCGRSTPHAELMNNTTQALVADIEEIRRSLGIEQWILFGGSWGSTLALVYAQTYPERVFALIVRGIALAREQDKKWFYQDGARNVFPDYWEVFEQAIPLDQRKDLVQAYYQRLIDPDASVRLSAAKAWTQWAGCCLSLQPSNVAADISIEPTMALSLARIECHYVINECFLAPNQILENMPKISHIPGIIVHGRYDMVCPLDNAWVLHKAWHLSTLTIVDNAGHSASEAGVRDALIRATHIFSLRFS